MKNLDPRTLSLSSGATLLGLILPMALLSGGCVDPKSRFQDFENAFPDASTIPADAMVAVPDAAPREVPDPTGTYYITFVTVGVDPSDETVTNLIWTLNATKDANGQPVSLTMTTQTLSTVPKGRTPVGMMLTNSSPISSGGEFVLDFQNFVLVGDANFTGGDLLLNATFNATIQTGDVFCGRIAPGNVISPIPLDLTGSTFVGVRVPPGTLGADLPAPVVACPPPPMPDGGLPDAGPPDAGTPDAPLPDAT
jgi:hypothetical protein